MTCPHKNKCEKYQENSHCCNSDDPNDWDYCGLAKMFLGEKINGR